MKRITAVLYLYFLTLLVTALCAALLDMASVVLAALVFAAACGTIAAGSDEWGVP